MTQAYPLCWPQGFPRSKSTVSSKFKTPLNVAINNVMNEMRLFGKDSQKPVENLVVSSNYTMTDHRPRDPGVAVYFRWDKIDCCIPIDRYPKLEDNLQAVALIIDAERIKLRHGGLNIVRAGFRGFAALPPPTGPGAQLQRPWRDVLGLPSSAGIAAAEARYRELVKKEHPDRGGDAAKFAMVVDAIRQARLELAA